MEPGSINSKFLWLLKFFSSHTLMGTVYCFQLCFNKFISILNSSVHTRVGNEVQTGESHLKGQETSLPTEKKQSFTCGYYSSQIKLKQFTFNKLTSPENWKISLHI